MKYNFYAGPAILPKEVMKEASASALDFDGLGLSILEISHRSKEFVAVLEEAISSVKELLGIGDEYEVLFLQGGASSQFYMSAMNFLGENDTAAYVDTGSWSTKAIKEAKAYGNVEILGSSKDKNFNYIPKGYEINPNSKYLHLTSNNTIFGTQFKSFPDTDVPLICDMSSDIFSRPIDVSKFGLIYAGAQKNLGPAGVTLAIINKAFLENSKARDVPTMLDYNTHVNKGSAFNTPPAFAIYVCMLTLRWLKAKGGLSAMATHNEAKAKLLYDEIDRNPLFYGTAANEDRSLMNVCFLLHNEDLQEAFLADCAAANCIGVKGHRSVGGFRASIYNAMSTEGIQTLVNTMQAFEKKHA